MYVNISLHLQRNIYVDAVTARAKQYQECNTLVTRIEVRIMRLKGRRVLCKPPETPTYLNS